MLRRGFSSLRVASLPQRVSRRAFGAFSCRRPVVEEVFRVHFTPFVASRPRHGDHSRFHHHAAPCRVAPASCADFFSPSPFVRIHESETAVEFELEVPRFRVADLHVEKNAKDGTITITGQRPAATAESKTTSDGKNTQKDFESEVRDFFSKVVESVTTTPNAFEKTLQVSPKHYDVAATSWTLDHGILALKVPRVKAPVPVAIVSDVKPTSSSFSSVVKITPEEFAAIAVAPWPPAVEKTQTGGAVVYTLALPSPVTTDHLSLHFDERAQSATLAVSCSFEANGAHRSQSQSVNFSTTLAAPEGTRAELVTAELKKGLLSVRFVGTPAPAAPAADAAPAATPATSP